MKRHRSLFCSLLVLGLSFGALPFAVSAENAAVLANIKTQRDIDAIIASTKNVELKQGLQRHSGELRDAAELYAHVQAVVRTVQLSPGKVEGINTTPESLKKVVGGDIAIFDTLKLVDLAIPNAGPHDHRKVDPYDAAFFEHLGHLKTLESLNIIATKLSDEWIAPLGKLTNLKLLRLVNNGKLTDVGMAHLAGLKSLESFSFVGTGMKGHAYAKFEGWTRLVKVSHRGSSIDDEGLRQLCEHLPNLETISLAHAKFTDAGAVHLNKLTKLKGLEIGTHNAKPSCLQHLTKLPLTYLQLGDGLDTPEGIALIKGISTLRRLTITNAKPLTEADLKLVASITRLEHLELSGVDLTEGRLALLKDFAFLKSIRIVPSGSPFTPETQAKIKQLLPKTELQLK
jgi:hypothetical protein